MTLTIYKTIGGKTLEHFLAVQDSVRFEVNINAVDIALRAEDLLKDHRVEYVAEIGVSRGAVDAYVEMNDKETTNGNLLPMQANSALSIEFGRAGFIDPETGEKWGASDPLHILTRAAGLPKKPRPRSRRVYLSKSRAFAAINAKRSARKKATS